MYIKTKDEFAHHDNWLHGTNTDEMEKAKLAHERQEARAKADELRDQAAAKLKTNDLWKTLLALLKPGENVYGALKRLRGDKQPAWKKKKTDRKPIKSEQDKQEEALNKRNIDAVTAIADKMMGIGHLDVYSDQYEQIIRKLRIEEVIDESWQPGEIPTAVLRAIPELAHFSGRVVEAEPMWEYKWTKDANDVFGPYSTGEIKAWKEQGFFDDKVVIRPVNASTSLDVLKGFASYGHFLD
jgi:hypothetical protein